jgi:hypothetical protein
VGFGGGIAENGHIVVTSWLEDHKDGRRRINKPFTNHGGLRRAWDGGDIVIGAKVKVILADRSSSPARGRPWQSICSCTSIRLVEH